MALNSNRHMDENEIEGYSMGAVSDGERARFDEHLLICESCRSRVAKSDDYLAAMQGASWRMRRQPPEPAPSRRFFPRLIPFFAAAGLVALVAIAGLRPWARVTAPMFAVSLEAMRGAGIDARAPAGRALLLNLQLAGLPVQASYRVETVDRVGKVVWQGTVPAQDSTAAAALPGMPAGVYFVRVYASSGELLREYGLEVQG